MICQLCVNLYQRNKEVTTMKNLDQSKHSIEKIFEKQMASPSVRNLLLTLHEDLARELNRKNLNWIARTHCIGITYLCNDQKAFMFVNVRKQFISIYFFTGNSSINGLKKNNWINRGDNKGSETYRIFDKPSLERAVLFAMKAYEIALNWSI